LKKARELFAENMNAISDGKNPNDERRKIRQDLTLRDFFNKEYFPKHCELSNKPRTCEKNIRRNWARTKQSYKKPLAINPVQQRLFICALGLTLSVTAYNEWRTK
jgi:hypothetical protein